MNATTGRLLGLAALTLAAGDLQAQAACPANTTVGTVMASAFSCTLGDKTFSAFTITGAPAATTVNFGQLGPLFAITLGRDGAFFPPGTTVFDYTVTAAAPAHILGGSVGVDVSFPTVVTVTTMNGMATSPASILNGGTALISFGSGVPSVTVDNISHITSPVAELNSITNDFAQIPISVLEPDSLPLALAGFLGLAVATWRRRK